MILLDYITPTKTNFILFSDPDKVTLGTITNTRANDFNFLLDPGIRSYGSWRREGKDLIISMDNQESMFLRYNEGQPYYTVNNGIKRTYYYNFYNQRLIDLIDSLI